MTTPGVPFPDDALSGEDLSQLDGLNEASWRAGINDRVLGNAGGSSGFNGGASAFSTIWSGFAGIFNGWFGGGGVGTPQEVQYTVEAIKQAILDGWVVDTIVATSTYVVPQCSELKVILIGGGQNGQDGGPARESNGGLGGGFVVEMLDAAALQGKTLNFSIASSGATTWVGEASMGILAECAAGSVGGIAVGPEGYAPTSSAPGNGGRGGRGSYYQDGSSTSPTPGTGSAKGAGGQAGTTGRPGTAGKAGGNVSAGASVKCGGGGGGGGGGGDPRVITDTYTAGPGGPGGYPGGGGGGGGGAGGWIINGYGTHGAGGIGAVGCAWVLWK